MLQNSLQIIGLLLNFLLIKITVEKCIMDSTEIATQAFLTLIIQNVDNTKERERENM